MGECQIQVSKPTILVSGYYVDTVGKNIKKIEEYIRNQLKEDKIAEQLTLEFEDPFTGKQK